MTKIKEKLFLAVNAVFLALIAATCALYCVYGTIYAKAAASGTFLLLALFNTVLALVRGKSGYPLCKYWLLGGLALAFAGDIALEYEFIAGVVLFALGHVLLLGAFHTLKPLGWRDILPTLLLIAGSVCLLLLLPAYHLGDLLAPVIVYAVVISAMLGKAVGVLLDRKLRLPLRLGVFGGALLFFASDLFLTFANFTEVAFNFSLPCLITYYLATYLLAVTIYLASATGERREALSMNVFARLYCRAFQGIFRLAIPFMPYRKPKLLGNCGEAAALIKEKGKRRPLIVTDAGVMAHGVLAPVTEALERAGIAYEIFDKTPANPTVSAIEEAFALYRERGCDCLMAVGGGSPMDCAKGVCARIIKPKKTLVRMQGILKVIGSQPLFIAVPTTAGTGSEATIAAVVTDDKTHHKFTILSFCLAPKYALLDPIMTKTLPPAPTAETGLDALTHAVETYIGRSTTCMTRRLAVSAVKRIDKNLLAAYRDGNDLSARKEMQLAAYEAGLAFTVSYVGYVHAVAHSLGGAYNYPHGRTNATLLPIVLRMYGKSGERRLAKLAKSSGICENSLPRHDAAEAFIAWVEDLNEQTGIPRSLEIAQEDIPVLAKNAAAEANPLYPVPRLMDRVALGDIYHAARTRHALSSEDALAAQKKYFATGATLDLKTRRRYLKKLYAALSEREDELNGALKADLGKSAYESYMCEVGMVRAEISHLLKHLRRYAKEKRVKTPLAQFASRSFQKPSPYGCVLVMSPWNYPVLLTLEPLADAIAAGNCVIVKPSAYSPATSDALKALLCDVFPPELVYPVLGGRAENAALLDLPFDKIFFTGSVAVGKEVMRRAAEKLIPVTLELGGKSPCIVDATANIPLAAKRIVFGKFLNCGQTCVAPDYILVHRSVEQRLLAELKRQIEKQYGAHPLENADYGKIISEKHFRRISALIDPAKVYCGGKTDEETLRIEPTVLQNVTREDGVMQEEIFGPVLPVLVYDDEEEIIADINAGNSPLALYLFTSKIETERKFLSRVAFGGGCVNDVVIHIASSELPFGGMGASGMGAYHGKAGFECFSHTKGIVDKKTWLDLPMRYQPYRTLFEKLVRFFMK